MAWSLPAAGLTTALALSALALPSADMASGPATAVRVAAVVTNAKGEPVSGLRAADFQVSVDGAPQAVDGLELTERRGEAPRVLALLLDEFHVDSAQSAAVRDALTAIVDAHLRANDLVVVFKPLASLNAIEPTADRQVVRDAIGSFEGRKGDYTPRTVFEQRYMAQAPNAVAAGRAQIVSSALRALAMRLAEYRDARPAVVLVSDGFARQRSDRNVPANVMSAVRVANRGDVPVYVFAPSAPLPVAQVGGEPDPGHTALQAVATQTGGDFTAGTAAFPVGLSRMFRDLDAHYVLSYKPAHGDDGRFHSVSIAVKRPDARVRARAGYVAALSAERRAAASAPIAPTRMLRRSPLIQSWSGVTRSMDGKPRVTFTWEPTPARPGAPGSPAAVLVVTATTPSGAVLFDGNVAAVGGTIPAGGSNRAEFDALPGRVQIDVKILDDKGVVLDTDSRDVEVPSLQSPRATILQPAVLRTVSAREFRAIAEDPDAPPVPSRDFRRTERLLLRVPAYEPGGAPARVNATLLNRWRQPMRALPPMQGGREGITLFDVPLAPLAPGEYTIRLTAGTATEHITFRVRG